MSVVEKYILGSAHLERCPFPIPYGWFFVEYGDKLEKGEHKMVNMLDQEWIVFRTESGDVGVTDPFCPHLGAHIGHGGKVVGESIRCPFHHWEYNSEGWCTKIPYANKMPPVCEREPVLRALPAVEKYGLIMCWYHPRNLEPLWELPDIPEFEPGNDTHVEPRHYHSEINTAIQELAENGVDNAHLRFLHGAPEIPELDVTIDGHELNIGMDGGDMVVHQYGPGLATFVMFKEGITAKMLSFSVPITKEKSHMNMMFTHERYPEGTKETMVASAIVDHMIGESEGEESAGFDAVDMPIWNNKKYRQKPILCDGDGPILRFRKYFKQFYDGAEN